MQQFNIDELTDYYKNPRSLSDKEFKQLKTSLDKFGMIDKPIVNADSANTIIGGHQRKHVLEATGVKEIECWIPDRELSDKEVEELNIRLNKNTGSWDFDTLANEFQLDDLLDWGFDKGELDLDLWASEVPEDVEPQIDKAEELRVAIVGGLRVEDREALDVLARQRDPAESLGLDADEPHHPRIGAAGLEGLHPHRFAEERAGDDLTFAEAGTLTHGADPYAWRQSP